MEVQRKIFRTKWSKNYSYRSISLYRKNFTRNNNFL